MEQAFITWIYANCRICNGDMLVEALENPINWERFLRDSGLPSDTEMDF